MVGLNIVKGLIRLALLYVATFAFFLLIVASVKLTRYAVDAAVVWPPAALSLWPELLEALSTALPFAGFAALLSSLIYCSRHSLSVLFSCLCLVVLSTGFLFGGMVALDRLGALKLGIQVLGSRNLGSDGRVLPYENGKAVLLGDQVLVAPRALSSSIVPRRAFSSSALGSGPRIPLGERSELPSFLRSAAQDLSLVFTHLREAFDRSPLSLLGLCGALSFLLVSFRALIAASRWPLANMIICFLCFRIVLVLDSFIREQVVVNLLHSIIPSLPLEWMTPATLGAFGLLITLTGLLSHIAFARKFEDA